MHWLSDPEAWIALATLTGLELVLGIDNIVFISILAGRLRGPARQRARILGLTAAMLMRSAQKCANLVARFRLDSAALWRGAHARALTLAWSLDGHRRRVSWAGLRDLPACKPPCYHRVTRATECCIT